MRKHLLGLVLIACMAGCTSEPELASASGAGESPPSAVSDAIQAANTPPRDPATSFASAPDQGALLAYGGGRKVRSAGAYTWHPISISEAHALKAIGSGKMVVNLPDGKPLDLDYQWHDEQPDGNWTWVGSQGEDTTAVLTFGDKAVFGTVVQAGRQYRIRTDRSGAWIVETDPRLLSAGGGRPADGHDTLMPPESRALAAAVSRQAKEIASVAAQEAPDKSTRVVDLVIGYSSTIATELGSTNAAITLMSNLVSLANTAYADSGVSMRLRLLHVMSVTYGDSTPNRDALRQLTGYNDETQQPITPNAAFNPLRAARNEYGADLVAFVRRYREPEQDGCGIAWLLGRNQTAITQADEAFGYAVVSDGEDAGNDGNTYFCSDYSLAHELGHLMGQAHNQENASDGGAHSYSFGYREASPTGFFTIMAYPSGDGQAEAPRFANPLLPYAGRASGSANADNVRSMNATMPIIANFRATVVPIDDQVPNIFVVKRDGVASTEVRTMLGANNYQAYGLSVASMLGKTGSDNAWEFLFGNFNGDARPDLYVIKKNGAQSTEVHVLNGANGFSTYLANTATILGKTGSDNAWAFQLGDYNGDGKLDLYVIKKQGAGNKVEVRVLNGANNFQTYLLSVVTPLGPVEVDYAWIFDVADYDGDGKLDLYVIRKTSPTGKTEVRVLSGASGFQTYLLSRATLLGQTGADQAWDFKVADYNRDGIPDVYGIKRMGLSGKTEIFVMNGATQYQSYLTVTSTILGATGATGAWRFDIL